MVKYNENGEIIYMESPREVMQSFLNIYCTHSCTEEDCLRIADCRKLRRYIIKIIPLGNPFDWLRFFIQIKMIVWEIRANEVEKALEQFKRQYIKERSKKIEKQLDKLEKSQKFKDSKVQIIDFMEE